MATVIAGERKVEFGQLPPNTFKPPENTFMLPPNTFKLPPNTFKMPPLPHRLRTLLNQFNRLNLGGHKKQLYRTEMQVLKFTPKDVLRQSAVFQNWLWLKSHFLRPASQIPFWFSPTCDTLPMSNQIKLKHLMQRSSLPFNVIEKFIEGLKSEFFQCS